MEGQENDQLFIVCDCGGCSAINFSFWEDEDIESDQVFLSFWSPCFYSHQGSIFENLVRRLKISFSVLFKGDYFLHDLILSRKDFERLQNYINDVSERGKK